MLSNLADIYADLLRRFGENLSIIYAVSPTYLGSVVGQDESRAKVVFLYEEDRNKFKTCEFISPSKLNIKKSPVDGADLDLTGSPLKDDCVVDAIDDLSLDLKFCALNPWKPEEEAHKGIDINKVRAIINTDEFQHTGSGVATQRGSVWFLCSGADAEKTMLLQYEFAQGSFVRGVVNFIGMTPTHAINAQTLVQHHLQVMRSSAVRVETFIENTYKIKSHIAIRCSWSTSAAVPSLIDLSLCDVVLSQTFCVSECGPHTQDFMNQLRILMIIRDDIIAYKEAAAADLSKEAVYRCGDGIDMQELHDSINQVMSEISGFAEIDSGAGTECDIETVLQRAKMRRLTDLTDKLWQILRRCSSYKDLQKAFKILFQCAARCNVVNTPTNTNRLAEIITEVANRRLAIPCLTGSEPLELLLEIGLEKLDKDYEFIFTESNICGANDLKKRERNDSDMDAENVQPTVRMSLRNAMRSNAPQTPANRKTLLHNMANRGNKFDQEDEVGFKNSNFNECDVNARLARLLQIHCILEHLLMINIHLNITNVYSAVCDQLLKKNPRIVDSINESLKDEIEISLSAHEVRELLEGKDPHSRRITMKSENKFREVKSTYYYNIDNVFPPGISECFQTEDKEVTRENLYYTWVYRKIKTVK